MILFSETKMYKVAGNFLRVEARIKSVTDH